MSDVSAYLPYVMASVGGGEKARKHLYSPTVLFYFRSSFPEPCDWAMTRTELKKGPSEGPSGSAF